MEAELPIWRSENDSSTRGVCAWPNVWAGDISGIIPRMPSDGGPMVMSMPIDIISEGSSRMGSKPVSMGMLCHGSIMNWGLSVSP